MPIRFNVDGPPRSVESGASTPMSPPGVDWG